MVDTFELMNHIEELDLKRNELKTRPPTNTSGGIVKWFDEWRVGKKHKKISLNSFNEWNFSEQIQ